MNDGKENSHNLHWSEKIVTSEWKEGKMFSIEEFIIAVFCCVDDVLIDITQIYPIKRRGFAPSLRESEVLTMEVVAEFLGIDADKDIWKWSQNSA